ncbi:MAG: hypothetical protein Q7S92_02325 [Candidatus Diapherotrites archaeon]|nr:hypothetical protein [Candidatus Diapherotrites archaeon]
MVTITLAVSAELKQDMEKFPEMNWSAVARAAIQQKINDLKFLKEFKKDSELTEEDAVRMGREVSIALGKRLLQLKKKEAAK